MGLWLFEHYFVAPRDFGYRVGLSSLLRRSFRLDTRRVMQEVAVYVGVERACVDKDVERSVVFVVFDAWVFEFGRLN